jgi:hypothetical protein
MNTCCIKTQEGEDLIYAMAEPWHLAQFNTTPTLQSVHYSLFPNSIKGIQILKS